MLRLDLIEHRHDWRLGVRGVNLGHRFDRIAKDRFRDLPGRTVPAQIRMASLFFSACQMARGQPDRADDFGFDTLGNSQLMTQALCRVHAIAKLDDRKIR